MTPPALMDEVRAELKADPDLDALYRRERQALHGETCPCENCTAYRAMDRDLWAVFACFLLTGLIILGVVWGITL